MTTDAENNKRIAKNTVILYFRMALIMAIALYTSRVVLNTLGEIDYGIYNVIGGVVLMFTFLNGAMAASTSRFITVELGKQDYRQLRKVFWQKPLVCGSYKTSWSSRRKGCRPL